MPTLTNLKLKNIVLFKKATLPLNHNGITVIRGLNKDADRRADDVTNAAGKSLLVSAISQVIRGSDPVSTDIKGIKSKAKGDFFTEPNSSITLEVNDNGIDYTIEKNAKKYTLLENGEDTNTRGMKYAEEKIQRLFNYSDDEFYTLYHISSSRPNTLQYGSATERLAFFTNLFKLNNYDEYRKIFNGMLSKLKRDVIILGEVKSDIASCKSDIVSIDYGNLCNDLDIMTRKQQSYNERLHKLYTKKNKFESILNNKNNYRKFSKLTNSLIKAGIISSSDNSDALFKTIEQVKSLLEQYDSCYEQMKDYEHYKRSKQAHLEEEDRFLEKLKKYETDFTKDDAEKFRELELTIAEYKGKLAQVNNLPKHRRNLDDLDIEDIKHRFLKYTGFKFEVGVTDLDEVHKQFEDDVQDSLTKTAMARKALHDFDKLDGCKSCPTCLQSLNNEGTAVIRKMLVKKLDKYEARLYKSEKIVDVIADANDFVKISAELEKVAKIEEARKLLESSIRKLERKHDKIIPEYERYVAYNKYMKAYKIFQKRDLDVVKKPKLPFTQDYALMLRDWCSTANMIIPVYDSLVSADLDIVENIVDDVSEQITSLSSRLKKYSDRVPEISSKISIYENTTKKLKELRKKRATLQQSADDVPVLEALIGAYSNKGIKFLVISRIAKIVENNMNKFSQLLYKERVKFRFEVSENSFNIFKEYTHNGKLRSVDIRRLSGAQSRCFSFLLPLSILPLIPAKKRLNVMILDEPVTNLDYATRKLFTESFVPKLNSVIPHLIIVTPLDDSYKNQKVYTVVKENGWSKLIAS